MEKESDKDGEYLAYVAAYEEVYCLFNVFVNAPALAHGRHYGGKVIVGKYHV